MIWLTTPSTPEVRAVMRAGRMGAMIGPADRKNAAFMEGLVHAIDNGCFTSAWTERSWLDALERFRPAQATCLFAVAPDVLGDAAATLERSRPWLSQLRALGYRPAFVGQDGLELGAVPWDEFDVWFTGGSTAWKLSEPAWAAAAEARRRGKWTHMGRANSHSRLAAAQAVYDSADGTFIKFAPTENLGRALRWLDRLDAEPQLWP